MPKGQANLAVITADIIGSTRYQTRERALITKQLHQAFRLVSEQYGDAIHTPATFRITAGDEFQWVLSAPAKAFEVVLFLRSIVAGIKVEPLVTFRASVGVGDVVVVSGKSSYEKDGSAFVRARTGLDFLAGSRTRWTALVTSDSATDRIADAVLTLLDSFQQRWTRPQWEAVRWALRGLNRTEIAAKLRVAHQSASKRLIAAEWDTFVVGCKLIGDLIESARTANPR